MSEYTVGQNGWTWRDGEEKHARECVFVAEHKESKLRYLLGSSSLNAGDMNWRKNFSTEKPQKPQIDQSEANKQLLSTIEKITDVLIATKNRIKILESQVIDIQAELAMCKRVR